MSTIQKLTDELNDLLRSYSNAREEGNYFYAEYVQLCIDEVRQELKEAEALNKLAAELEFYFRF